MSEPKVYPVKSGRDVEMIEFVLGEQTFRVPKKTRPDVLRMLTTGEYVVDGEKRNDEQILRMSLINLVTDVVYDPENETADEAGWVTVDDKMRLVDLISPSNLREYVETSTLATIVADIVEAIADHPSGAPSS